MRRSHTWAGFISHAASVASDGQPCIATFPRWFVLLLHM